MLWAKKGTLELSGASTSILLGWQDWCSIKPPGPSDSWHAACIGQIFPKPELFLPPTIKREQNKTNSPKSPSPQTAQRERGKKNFKTPGLHNPVPPTCISHKLSTSHRNLPTLHITAQCSRQRHLNPWCFRQLFKPPSVYLGSPAL